MPLPINEDGTLPMWIDAEGRRHLVASVETQLVSGGDGSGGGPHTHPESDVTNLTTDLAAKASTGHNHDAAYSASGHTHAYAPTSHSHVDADLPAGLARDSEVTSAIATHAGLADPHPGYLTPAEGNAAYATVGHTHAGGSHPDLATHDALGLATDAELTAHAQAADPHPGYLTAAEGNTAYEAAGAVATHAAAGDPHPTYATDAALTSGLSGKSDTSHVHANDHARQHSITSSADHTFPGGTTNFLRADGTFAAPPAGQGSSELYAVGDLYITTRSGDPATLLGYGTWSRFGAGRFLLLTDSTAGVTGGSATHSHSFTQPNAHTEVMTHTHGITDPGHVHDEFRNSATTGGLDGWAAGDTSTNTPILTGYDTGSKVTGITVNAPAGAVASIAHAGGAVADGSTDPLSITAFAWLRTA